MSLRFRQLATVCALGGLTAACASGGGGEVRVPKTAGVYKVGNPYQIDNVWYYPHEQPDYDETGIASWYGPTFHGKRTANGETFDSNDLTAAHRTLPMPVNVRVTNLDNGKSLILRVNDRGPYARNRILDVSEHAAELLGYKNAGTARVRVTYIGRADGAGPVTPPAIATAVAAAPAGQVDTAALDIVPGATVAPPVQAGELPAPVPEPPPQPVQEPTGQVQQVPVPAVTHLYVQVGAFSTYDNAVRLANRLGGNGLNISPITRNGQTLYRVRSGPYATTGDADNALARINGAGSNDARIVVDQ
jgi:rare lipoprotein A